MIQRIHNVDIRKWETIITAVTICKMSPITIFGTRVADKKSSVIVCAVHMHLILHTEAKYDCVLEIEVDVFFKSLNKRFCKHCIKNYMRKVYQNFPFTIFNAE